VFATVAKAEQDLIAIAEDRESELEERAQEERAARLAARLDDRGKLEIESIDAALRRIAEGRYGKCVTCKRPIAVSRLRALPETLHCIACASGAPAAPPGGEVERPAPSRQRLPAELALLSNRELEEYLWEQVRGDARIDTDELNISCRGGIVHLTGTVPSEREHQQLVKLLTDVCGLREVDDRLAVNELLWDREDRTREPEATAPEVLAEVSARTAQRYEIVPPTTTEDITESNEEDVEYAPPVTPPREEE
jgi:RNA polymerase-binding transcription factor DksA